MIKQFSSKFGLNDTVVVNLGNNRLFGNITAVKFEDQIIKYDIYLEGMKSTMYLNIMWKSLQNIKI